MSSTETSYPPGSPKTQIESARVRLDWERAWRTVSARVARGVEKAEYSM